MERVPNILAVLVAPVVFDQACKRQACVVSRRNGAQRGLRVLPMPLSAVICSQRCRRQPVTVGGVYCHQGLCHVLPPDMLVPLSVVLDDIRPAASTFPRPFRSRHDIRCRRPNHKLVHAADDTPHGVWAEWSLCGEAVLITHFLPRIKDGRARQRPVDDFRRAPPRLSQPCLRLRAVSRRVGRLRPRDGPPVAAGNEKKPLARCWRAIVRSHQLAPLDVIPQVPELPQPLCECLSGL